MHAGFNDYSANCNVFGNVSLFEAKLNNHNNKNHNKMDIPGDAWESDITSNTETCFEKIMDLSEIDRGPLPVATVAPMVDIQMHKISRYIEGQSSFNTKTKTGGDLDTQHSHYYSIKSEK